jgi:hypothetical protein
MASRDVEAAPVSIHKEEEYKMLGFRPPFKEYDAAKSVAKKNMETTIHPDFRQSSPVSKRLIQPLKEFERSGPKWGN